MGQRGRYHYLYHYHYHYLYLTDQIKVYFWMRRHRWGSWVTLQEIHEIIDISKAQDTYMMALLETFDDIVAKPDGSAIRFVPPSPDEEVST